MENATDSPPIRDVIGRIQNVEQVKCEEKDSFFPVRVFHLVFQRSPVPDLVRVPCVTHFVLRDCMIICICVCACGAPQLDGETAPIKLSYHGQSHYNSVRDVKMKYPLQPRRYCPPSFVRVVISPVSPQYN